MHQVTDRYKRRGCTDRSGSKGQTVSYESDSAEKGIDFFLFFSRPSLWISILRADQCEAWFSWCMENKVASWSSARRLSNEKMSHWDFCSFFKKLITKMQYKLHCEVRWQIESARPEKQRTQFICFSWPTLFYWLIINWLYHVGWYMLGQMQIL